MRPQLVPWWTSSARTCRRSATSKRASTSGASSIVAMVSRRIALIFAASILSCATAFSQVPSDAEIRKILKDRIGMENAGLGIVVGVIDANGRRVVAYGSLAKDNSRRLDGDTVFEIGSMTKV